MRSWREADIVCSVGTTAEPARGFHALFKCCEAAICTATVVTAAVIRTPWIVLGFAWSDKHSCCSDSTEHKDKSHQSIAPPYGQRSHSKAVGHAKTGGFAFVLDE